MGRSAAGAQTLVIVGTIEKGAESAATPLFRLRPLAHLPGGLMPHMLGVAALELRDPLAFFILMKADDSNLHLPTTLR